MQVNVQGPGVERVLSMWGDESGEDWANRIVKVPKMTLKAKVVGNKVNVQPNILVTGPFKALIERKVKSQAQKLEDMFTYYEHPFEVVLTYTKV